MLGPTTRGPSPAAKPDISAHVHKRTIEGVAPSTTHMDSDLQDVRSPKKQLATDESSNCTAHNYLFNCYYTNANSIMNKGGEFEAEVDMWKPKIIGITESWCEESVLDSEISLPDFTLFRGQKIRCAWRSTTICPQRSASSEM